MDKMTASRHQLCQRISDDILVFLFFCISGNPAFSMEGTFFKLTFGIMVLILLAASRFRINREAWKSMKRWTVFLVIIFGIQLFTLGEITILGSLNYIFKFWCAILLVNALGRRLPTAALRVMTWICIISLPFYLINLSGIRFHTDIPILCKGESLIIYTQSWDDPSSRIFRNSGMFWEPGAFAGYIIFTILLNIDRLHTVWQKNKLGILIMTIALLTTTSTTGYFAFAFIALYFVWSVSKNKIISVVIVCALVVGAVTAFFNLDFLGDKIRKQFEESSSITEGGELNYTRFGSIIFDLEYITTHPIFGNGLSNSTRFRFHNNLFTDEDLGRFGNGFSGCIASMGLLFTIAFLISVANNHRLKSKAFTVMMIIILLQGEYFLNYPFCMLFPFADFGSRLPMRKRKKIRLVWKKKIHA